MTRWCGAKSPASLGLIWTDARDVSLAMGRRGRPAKCLYLTFDGLLEPLGYSQIVRVLRGVTDGDLRYDIISLEREDDLADSPKRDELRSELARHGIGWNFLRYDQAGSRRAASSNLMRLAGTVLRSGGGYDLVHARSYPAAAVALGAGGDRPLLFDTRGYWLDERAEQGRWFRNPLVLRAARGAERLLYRRAIGVVTLTEISAEEVRCGRFGPVRHPHLVEAIPTVVDFEAFTPSLRGEGRRMLAERFPSLGEGPVVGFVGSVNSWYKVDEGLDLFRYVHLENPSARLVVLSGQFEEIARRLRRVGIPEEAFLATRVSHREMPLWVPALDHGLLLLGTSPAKRASMPTKLGEFIAAGVRPIHIGCNSEVGDWVRRTGTGITLPELSEAALRRAASMVARAARDEEGLWSARQIARSHFSLESAIERYRSLIRRIAAA